MKELTIKETELFSELKESEDEKIRRVIRGWIYTRPASFFDNGISKEEILAWLEKQGGIFTKKDVDDAYLEGVTNTKNEIEKQYEANYQIRKDIATFIFNYRGDIKDRAKWMDYLGIKVSFVEKQSKQETLCEKCKKEQPSHSCQDITALGRCYIEGMNTADKVEPKFKVGDWVMLDRPVLITKVDDMPYNIHQYWTSDGTWFGDTTKAKLWTIQDAKDGDVLTLSYASRNYILVYKGLYEEGLETKMSVFCFYSVEEDTYYDETDSFHAMNTGEVITPSTKEQRDTLIQAMTDAGYAFDFEKKELKKIEQKHIDKVESKFKVGDWVVRGDTIAQILDIQEQYYVGLDINGKDFTSSRFLNDDKIHLWTINDAKTGDVLVCKGNIKYSNGVKYERICLFNNLDKAFFTLVKTSNYVETYDIDVNIDYPDNTVPATKEQREILFMAMAGAGYEWDAEKKELKKINTYCQENCKGYQETGKCFADGECKAKKEYIEQKHNEWSEEDERERKRVVGLLEGWLSTFKETNYAEDCKRGIEWLKSLNGKIQSKQEWSEEDEAKRNALIGIVKEIKNQPLKRLQDWDGYISWLESLRPQPKQVWSKEDKDYYDAIITKLEVTKDDALLTNNQMEFLKSLKDRVQPKQEWSEEDERIFGSFLHKLEVCDLLSNKEIRWAKRRLKYLRPQNHWKPTEAQLASLTIACDRNDRIGFDLTELLKELKKL